ncbi:UDP-glucose 4-epimerase [Nymphon striatum]|nr:UDP-glucose 4-epimerase [Nymphon striatum]
MESIRKNVLLTGGAGYIGSHCAVELLKANFDVTVVDNLTNCVEGCEELLHPSDMMLMEVSCPLKPVSLMRVEEITNRNITFYACDLLDKPKLEEVFTKAKIDIVIHLAAMKAVGESMQVPLQYYKNNVVGTINLLEVMTDHKVHQMVFSSSCTVYGEPEYLPLNEKHPTGNISNVYGKTKLVIEEMLKDLCHAEKQWNVISLRYFNPIGAHPTGKIGEDPTKAIANIMPYISQVANGSKDCVTIYGNDYKTDDGTGVRDYIHVMDLASGHVAAAKQLHGEIGFRVYNLGSGKGVSVMELCDTFEKVSKRKIMRKIMPRRPGDIAASYADSSLAEKELNWKAVNSLEKMCMFCFFLFVKTFGDGKHKIQMDIGRLQQMDLLQMVCNTTKENVMVWETSFANI